MAIFSCYHKSLAELLESPPRKGEGHRWFFRVALHMRHYHNPEQVFKFLRTYADEWKDRAVPDAEIRKAINKAFHCTSEEIGEIITWRWPEPDEAVIKKVVAETKPLVIEPLLMTASEALQTLFPRKSMLCVGMSNENAGVRTLPELLSIKPERFSFIVPSPMTAAFGTNKENSRSCRCLDNTGPRMYLVVESDCGTKDEQASILAKLAGVTKNIPLVMVVDSAGKSLHGWFFVQGVPENISRAWFEYAVYLGADAHTWTKCQWVRMPGGTRYPADDSQPKRQHVVWLNPKCVKEPHQ